MRFKSLLLVAALSLFALSIILPSGASATPLWDQLYGTDSSGTALSQDFGYGMLEYYPAGPKFSYYFYARKMTPNANYKLIACLSDNVTGWTASTGYILGNIVSDGFEYKCTVAGTSGATEPVWPTTLGDTVVDGTVTWTCIRRIPGDLTMSSTVTCLGSGKAQAAYLDPPTNSMPNPNAGKVSINHLGLKGVELNANLTNATVVLVRAADVSCTTPGTTGSVNRVRPLLNLYSYYVISYEDTDLP